MSRACMITKKHLEDSPSTNPNYYKSKKWQIIKEQQMKHIAILIVIQLSYAFVCIGQNEGLQKRFLKDSLNIIKERVERHIIPTRYMEKNLIAITDTLAGWEGVNVTLYEYKVDNGKKSGKVYMANADSEKLAAWIITTCVVLTGTLDKSTTDILIKAIRKASGGQFPVKGIVYENMDGKGYKPYMFKDGVTVFLNQPNSTDIALLTDENIKLTGKYARILSTTRHQYNRIFPNTKTDGNRWLEVVREEYKSALASNINNLMIAWAADKLNK